MNLSGGLSFRKDREPLSPRGLPEGAVSTRRLHRSDGSGTSSTGPSPGNTPTLEVPATKALKEDKKKNRNSVTLTISNLLSAGSSHSSEDGEKSPRRRSGRLSMSHSDDK